MAGLEVQESELETATAASEYHPSLVSLSNGLI